MGDVNYDDLRDEANVWLQDTLNELGCEAAEATQAICLKLHKPRIAEYLSHALDFVSQFVDSIRDLKNSNSELKSQIIEAQKSVIETQTELSVCKTEQLDSLKKTVQTSVEDSVKAEFNSYSAALKSNLPQEHTISSKTLKHVVKSVVQEEDRSRNVMIFGLPEEPNEQLDTKVTEVFEAIGQRPKIDACRMGRTVGKAARPVKVTVSNSLIVDQILSKTRNLKDVNEFKAVFVCPDRSSEEREKQRELVKQLKELAANEPGKRYYIKSGKICSAKKPAE